MWTFLLISSDVVVVTPDMIYLRHLHYICNTNEYLNIYLQGESTFLLSLLVLFDILPLTAPGKLEISTVILAWAK